MHSEPPLKRRRLSTEVIAPSRGDDETGTSESSKEFEVGVRAFVNPASHPLYGLLKTRYTDFLVNEITPSGDVLHLKSTRYRRPGVPAEAPSIVENTPGPAQTDNPASATDTVAEVTTTRDDTSDHTVQQETEEASKDVSVEDREKLANYLDPDIADKLIDLYISIQDKTHTKPRDFPKLQTPFTSDRTLRGEIHQFIRTTFHSRIDSTTNHNGNLILSVASASHAWSKRSNASQPNGNVKNRQGKLSWDDKGGEYVHFTLYKENKDTMEAIQWLCRQLKCNAKVFQFAGTKDRRAVTTQRCSAFRIDADRLANQNKSLRQSMVGDFEYREQGLELGELQGNEFVITLRDCKLRQPNGSEVRYDLITIQKSLEESLRSLHTNGYLNYYGLQRFGTFTMRTDAIGRHILRTDFQAACDAILHVPDHLHSDPEANSNIDLDSVGRDDKARAAAIILFRTNPAANVRQALEQMPRKFNAESTIIRHLSRAPADFFGALMQIQRNLRLMYVHAYQSLVWNLAVTKRWELYGSKVVAGDLVLISEHRDNLKSEESYSSLASSGIEIDTDGEIIIQPGYGDSAGRIDDIFERARVLTPSEAESGRYTIFDLVMPLPGYDVVYPENASGESYRQYMASEEGGGLNPHEMRRKQKDFSLSGSYRKILARIGREHSVDVHEYTRDEEQFVMTDAERLRQGQARIPNTAKPAAAKEDQSLASTTTEPNVESKDDPVKEINVATSREAETKTATRSTLDSDHPRKVALILKFQLGSSQYATMALRELSHGGITAYKPDFSGGR